MSERLLFPQYDKAPAKLPEGMPTQLVVYGDRSANIQIGRNPNIPPQPFKLADAVGVLTLEDALAYDLGLARVNTSQSNLYFDCARKLMIAHDKQSGRHTPYDLSNHEMPTIEIGELLSVPGLVESRSAITGMLVLADTCSSGARAPRVAQFAAETKKDVVNSLMAIIPAFNEVERQLQERGLREPVTYEK